MPVIEGVHAVKQCARAWHQCVNAALSSMPPPMRIGERRGDATTTVDEEVVHGRKQAHAAPMPNDADSECVEQSNAVIRRRPGLQAASRPMRHPLFTLVIAVFRQSSGVAPCASFLPLLGGGAVTAYNLAISRRR